MRQRLSEIPFSSFVLGTVTLTALEETSCSCSNDHQLEITSGLWWNVFTSSLALEPCIVQTTAEPVQAVSVCEFTCVPSIPLFPWYLSLPLILIPFLLSRSQDFLIPEGSGGFDGEITSFVECLSFSVYCLYIGFCICFHFLHKEPSLMMGEQDTHL